MGFTILIFFGPLILGIMLLEFLMIWLKSALNVVVAIMLAVNAVFFLALLLLRFRWKATGRMEPGVINNYEGWRRYGLLGVKLLLTWGVAWEALLVVGCALLLFFRPWTVLMI